MIILERDGSLSHYPPGPDKERQPRARVDIPEERAEQTVIDRILDFTFDFLGASSLEVRVYEHQG